LFLLCTERYDKLKAMRFRALIVLFACCVGSLGCQAQTAPTAQSIEAQLQGRLLLLRGRYDGPELKFDAEGHLKGNADQLPFGLSAVRLDKVKVKDAEVQIDATREGLEFKAGDEGAHAWPWDRANTVRIRIAWDPSRPDELRTAIGNIFAADVDAGLAKDAPACWRVWLLSRKNNQQGPLPEATYPGVETPGGKVTDPKLLYASDPRFSAAARELRYGGMVVVGLIVDASGKPQDVHIVLPLGMGLDEEAVAAVEQYRFAPAKYEGKPVPVEINVEVNFRIGGW
jgi:TonB family protein